MYVSSPLRAKVSVDQLGQDVELGIFGDSAHCGPSSHKHVREYVLSHWIFNDYSICMCLCMVVSEFWGRNFIKGGKM